ncbi:hypothetical protein CAPTEDRAFT_186637 [Capitella teleta]|uniref:Uncharacterized protein n=1 Tax=Capitella teleta TaxID=283909 RepID=R7TPW4_CAPTE|nr:hypothetical protein CAPTEDRAFT_186637 [Capitella teleta]|eukprot:ELT95918.1 hypothetical protein CAPTEDRAFT_186637 [Capitella teleta]
MSFKKSEATVSRNREKWQRNLTTFDQSKPTRRHVAIQESSLATFCRMPQKEQIVGRSKFLETEVKSRKQREVELSKGGALLWQNKLNFSMISEQAVCAKIVKVLQLYDKCCRKGKFEPLDELFDITKLSGEWLNAIDKELYHKQVDRKGRVGYSTATEPLESDTKELGVVDTDEPDDSEDYCEASSDERTPTKRQYNKSQTATRLVTCSNLSTKKAVKVCKQLSTEGIDIPPCQFVNS